VHGEGVVGNCVGDWDCGGGYAEGESAVSHCGHVGLRSRWRRCSLFDGRRLRCSAS
jgi:hypothetical protein